MVSVEFPSRLGKEKSLPKAPLVVSMPTCKVHLAETVYPDCKVSIFGHVLDAKLWLLPSLEMDMILGMDWLSAHYAPVDYRAKAVIFSKPELPQFFLPG